MSYQSTVGSLEVPRRIHRAQTLLVLVYVGVPLLFAGNVLGVSVLWSGQEDDRPSNAQALLIPAGVLLIGASAGWVRRHRPQAWAAAGAWLGGTSGFAVAFYAYAMQIGEPFDAPYDVVAYAGVLLLPVGWLLGRWARTTLLVPPVVELADTPYDLVYPLRGARRTRLLVRVDVLAVQERVSVPAGGGERRTQWKAAGIRRLDAVTDVGEIALTGAERLAPALALQRSLPSTPGPALTVDVPEGRWVLPLDDAVPIAWIITRRIAAATGGR